MKLCVFLMLFTPLLWATNAIPVGGAPDVQGESASGSLALSNQELEYVLEDPSAKVKYDRCKQLVGAATLNTDVSTCLWEGTYTDKATGNTVTDPNLALSTSEQEQVAERLGSLKTGGRAPANDDKKFESQDLNFLQKAESEPAFKAIRDHMIKKLNETIYGDAERGKLKMADHRVFHELYKSQLSKNVIQAMSSYCLDADPGNDFLVPGSSSSPDLDSVRTSNLNILKDPTLVPDPNNTGKQTVNGKINFDTCIRNLKHICYATANYAPRAPNTASSPCASTPTAGGGKGPRCEPEYDDSKTRACNVVTYINQLKQNIVAVQKIEDRFNELEQGNKGQGLSLGGGQQLEMNSRTENVEVITNMSSKEFVEESGFKDKLAEEQAEFEKCFENIQTDPSLPPDWKFTGDAETCKKFLNENKEEASKFIAEADTRTRALEVDLKKTLAEDEQKGVESYLKDQAYTEEQIEQIKNDPAILADVRRQIENRYKAEREAYIKTLADKVKSRTMESDGDFANAANPDISKLEEIGNELVGRTKKYTELIHFNNIVSGYLETEDSQGNRGTNTTAAAMELENSAYDPNPRSPAGTGAGSSPANTDDIKAALEAAGIKAEIEEDKSNTLQQGDINEIFKYDNTP